MDLFLDEKEPWPDEGENCRKRNPTHEFAHARCIDANTGLSALPDASVDLVVSSPPYNIGKEYEQDQRLSLDDYLASLEPIVDSITDKLRPTGSVCWQVGHYVERGEVFPLDIYFYHYFKRRGFKLRNRVIWHFNFGLHATNRLSGRYETILWFTKSDQYKFNLDDIRVPQLYPGKKHSRTKRDRAGKPSGNPKGKNPSDFWSFSPTNSFLNDQIWDIPNVKANHPEKTIHPCQFPVEVAERCVLAFTDPGDFVVDPFVGTGTTLIASEKHRRRALGFEKDRKYVDIARSRLSELRSGDLRMRRSGEPPVDPSPNAAVAKVPSTWLDNDGDKE